ncbi:MAG TPA: TIGR03435 family protein [Bryobacteraceae bacterium]|jgi:uncharacterized protein (TIGR03435 family)|nr:TIGR03435 family protein [Bryobacteraceae bacterium]
MRAAIILLFACLAQAQVYEVASIKPSQGGGPPGPRVSPGGRLNTTNTTLKSLIEFAYDVRSYEVSGGPLWLDSAGWDIVATPDQAINPSAKNVDSFRLMVRALLSERFQLAVHRATKELNVYALVVAKDGLKLRESGEPEKPTDGRLHISNGLLVGQKIALKFVAPMLAEYLGRPVTDRTGLTGNYDFELRWTPDPTENPLPTDAGQTPPDPGGPTLFTALQEQLGLKLESRKGPVEILIVDRAEKASEN